jgi:hypothetical protein
MCHVSLNGMTKTPNPAMGRALLPVPNRLLFVTGVHREGVHGSECMAWIGVRPGLANKVAICSHLRAEA